MSVPSSNQRADIAERLREAAPGGVLRAHPRDDPVVAAFLARAPIDLRNLLSALDELLAECDALRAALQAVTDLHHVHTLESGMEMCWHCDQWWPCPTFRAASASGVGTRPDTGTEEK